MKAYLNENRLVYLSDTDYSGYLSVPSMFRYFQDIATCHADILGVGYQNMIKKNMFWVAVKTIVEIKNRPYVNDNIILETFPSEPVKLRCDRNYNIYDFKGDIMIQAKTEWTVINFITKRPEQFREVYPSNIEYVDDKPILLTNYSKYDQLSADYNKVCEYKVVSTDLDLGMHLNNAEYIRIIFSLYKTEELKNMNITKVEINYKSPAYEGEVITFYKKESTYSDEFIVLNKDDKVVINAIILKEKN